jgi:tetratricopeptide (TPR) repeat protein
MKTRLISLTSLAFLFITISAHADWMQEQDMPYTIVNSSDDVVIDKNGYYESTQESEMKVVNEKGRNELVLQTIPFAPDASTVTFVKASTLTDGVESPVNAKDVTTRSAKGPQQGINHLREMVIPFNNIKIGSITKYTVKIKTKKNMVKGLYQQTYVMGVHAPEWAGRAKIKSLLPLYVNVNDPWKVLETKESKEGEYYVFEFKQVKPLFKVPQEALAILRKDQISRVDVSTMNNWADFITPISQKYENILATKTLPAPFTRIVNKAKKATTTTEKIDIVTSELANIMTYAGSWTTLEKMYIAQPLKDIARTKTGDCKDFSLATTAMLRAMGIDAKVALVRRSSLEELARLKPEIAAPELVNPSLFNHAIVKVKDGENILWVDPTNMVSNAGYIFSDIAGSHAIEVSDKAKALEFLPYPKAGDSLLTFDKTIKINQDNTSDTTTKFEATGEYTKYMIEASLSKSEEAGKKTMMTYLRSNPENAKGMYEGINFRNRIVNKIAGTQKTIGEELTTWHDQKLYLDTGFPQTVLYTMALIGYRVTDANLIARYSEKSITHVKGFDFVGYQEGCSIYTPWYTISRDFIKEDGGFKIVDDISFNEVRISAKDLNSDKFQYLTSDIPECFKGRQVLINPIAPAATLQSRLDDYSIIKANEKLDIGGPKSIQGAHDAYHIANQLLDRDPENKDALLVKARALRRINYIHNGVDRKEYLDLASDIVEKLNSNYPNDPKILQQKTWILLSREDKSALSNTFNQTYKASQKDFDLYYLGGKVLEELKQNQAAIGSYNKALEIAHNNPDKARAGAALGELLIQQGKVENGIAFYKYAIKADPGNSWLAGNFTAYIQQLGRWDDAISVGEEVVKTNPYGMAKKVLADAYAGKGTSIRNQAAKNPLEQAKALDSAEQLYAKGLSHSPDNDKCLKGLAEIYFARAMTDFNPMTAQKSLRYIDKAIAGKKISSESFIPMKNTLNMIVSGTLRSMPKDKAAAMTAQITNSASQVATHEIPQAPSATPVVVVAPTKTPASVGTPTQVIPPSEAPKAVAPVTTTTQPATPAPPPPQPVVAPQQAAKIPVAAAQPAAPATTTPAPPSTPEVPTKAPASVTPPTPAQVPQAAVTQPATTVSTPAVAPPAPAASPAK